MNQGLHFVFIVMFWGLLLDGCSISESITSSYSSSESSGSSSSSSGKKNEVSKEMVPYRDDVANLTFSIAGSSMSPNDFSTALTRTATQYRISDWSQQKATYYGVGKGLKKAGVLKESIAQLPYLSKVLASDQNAVNLIEKGYGQ